MQSAMHIFIPPSWRAGTLRQAIEAAAAAQGLTVEFVPERATDALLLASQAQINVYQQLDFQALTPAAAHWTVVPPPGSEDAVRLFQTLHPDLGRAWAVTHGSEGLAAALWLTEYGAELVAEDNLRIGENLVEIAELAPTDQSAAPELAPYAGFHVRTGREWSLDASLLANSPGLTTDSEEWHDLSGRARHLLIGPHIFLPAGEWRVDLEFDIDVEEGAPRLFLEWGGASLKRVGFTTIVRTSGTYQASLESRFDHPDAAQCLIATDAAQLQGRFRFKGCKLTRLGKGAPPQTHAVIDNWA